jgi:hypothetical protein
MPRLEINLSKYIDDLASDRLQKRAILPLLNRPAVKSIFAQEAIQTIIDRTQSGVDKNGKKFKEYSETYTESSLFKTYGKSESPVDLLLTGDMQAAINFKIGSKDRVSVLIEDDQADKAEGHIKGTRSKNGKRHLPKRDFFGLSDKEIVTALKKAISEFNSGDFEDFEELTEVVNVSRNDDFDITVELSEID